MVDVEHFRLLLRLVAVAEPAVELECVVTLLE